MDGRVYDGNKAEQPKRVEKMSFVGDIPVKRLENGALEPFIWVYQTAPSPEAILY